MRDADRFRLRFAPYRPPRCRVGRTWLRCAVRGKVKVVGISDTPVMWPQCKAGKWLSPIICGSMIRAIKGESNQAVARGWGVTPQTVTLWRKALSVPRATVGTRSLHAEWGAATFTDDKRERVREANRSPIRAAKIAAAKRGKRRLAYVIEALRQANVGRKLSAQHRAKLSAARRRRGTRPPAAGRPWTPEEEALMGTMLDRELATRFHRHPNAVYVRRKALGIPSYRHQQRDKRGE